MRRPQTSLNRMLAVIGGLAIATACGIATAQNPTRSYSAGARAGGQAGGQLPFSSTYRRPTVSPYQQLSNFANNPQAAPNLYSSVVQPAQQQQQQEIAQLSLNRQFNKLQNQVQQIQQGTQGRQVDESIRPTGHRATYMNYSHFYPQ